MWQIEVRSPTLGEMMLTRLVPAAFLFIVGCSSHDGLGGDDQDGISGGNSAFAVTVDDASFAPSILKTENLATVTLTLTNKGTKPHGFAVACKPTACFPESAKIEPIAPAASATAKFETPWVEGIYVFNSSAPGDEQSGQFIIQ
jgi:hypothetical protein